MIAVFTCNEDGERTILAVLSDERYIKEYIEKYTKYDYNGKGNKNSDYWIEEFSAFGEGILCVDDNGELND